MGSFFAGRSLTMNKSGVLFVGVSSVLLMLLTLPIGTSGEKCSPEVCKLCNTNCNECNQCILCHVCLVKAFCGMCNQCKNGNNRVDVAFCKKRCNRGQAGKCKKCSNC